MIRQFVIALLLFFFVGQDTKPNFSGNWHMNVVETTSKQTYKTIVSLPKRLIEESLTGPPPPPAPAPPPPPLTEEVIHEEPRLSLPGWTWFGNRTLQLVTDGSEQRHDLQPPGHCRTKVRWQGKTLHVEWVRESVSGETLEKGQGVLSFADNKSLPADKQNLIYDATVVAYLKGAVNGYPYEAERTTEVHRVMMREE